MQKDEDEEEDDSFSSRVYRVSNADDALSNCQMEAEAAQQR